MNKKQERKKAIDESIKDVTKILKGKKRMVFAIELDKKGKIDGFTSVDGLTMAEELGAVEILRRNILKNIDMQQQLQMMRKMMPSAKQMKKMVKRAKVKFNASKKKK